MSKKKKLVIADCLQLIDINGYPSGHYIKTSKQYANLLGEFYDVIITSSVYYSSHLLNYNTMHLNHNVLDNKFGFINKIKRIFKLISNMIKVLSSNSDKIIIQACDLTVMSICLLFYFGNKQIYLIRYDDLNSLSRLKKLAFRVIKHKISGLITGLEKSLTSYNTNGIVVSDYFYDPKENLYKEGNGSIKNNQWKYDFSIIGIIREDKNIEDVINTFSGTNYNVCIAGRIVDATRLENLKEKISSNIQIINDYISEEKYKEIITNSKFIVLPYKKGYNHTSSGVIFDAIYNKKPVIVSNVDSFTFIKKEQLGIVYNNSIEEILPQMSDNNDADYLYEFYINNTKKFISKNEKVNKERLVNFLLSHS